MTGNGAREGVARAAGDLPGALAASAPNGFDFIVDILDRKGLLDMALPLLRPGGTAAIYGIDEVRAVTVDPNRAAGTFTYYSGGDDEGEVHDEVVALLRRGALDAGIWLDLERPFALEDINNALDAVADRRLVKALVRLGD
jgi:Zn-dependent alcohol dehydrogenase